MIEVGEGITQTDLAVLYADPYIQRVGWDEVPASPVIHPVAKYLTATVYGNFAGAFLAIRFSDREIEMHSLLRKEYIEHSRELGAMSLDWAFTQDGVHRVTAYITGDLVAAMNYCLKLGFKFEGIRREACSKNGKPLDVHIFGILKSEWMNRS